MTREAEPPHAPDADGLRRFLARLGEAADRRELGLWLVGGALRDLLLGRATKDVDLAVEAGSASVLELAARLATQAGWSLGATHARFGTATLAAPGGIRVDLAAARHETYPHPGALPVVTGPATIDDDLGRRDFTIHAMARRVGPRGLVGPVLDPFGGKKDLAEKRLRLLHPKSLVDDPTRAYRAVKYAVRLEFTWDDGEMRRALKAARSAGSFTSLSGDRMRRGLEEIFLEGEWGRAARLTEDLSLLRDVSPEWHALAPRSSADDPASDPPSSPSKKTPNAESRTDSRAAQNDPGVSRPKAEEIWRRLLEPLSDPERAAVAARLCFSRKLRRAAGVPA